MVLSDDEKKLALILGVATGDALGVPVEFNGRGTFHVADMQGYGTYNQPPGTWSDDTSLTLALADGLTPEEPDLQRIASHFIAWYDEENHTPHGKVFDIGGATRKAIVRLKRGVAPEQAGGTGEGDNGNGSLMRIAPLAWYLSDVKDREERFRIVRAVSSLTHAHDWSVIACFIDVEMLIGLLAGKSPQEAYAQLRRDFQDGMSFLDQQALQEFDRVLRSDISRLPEEAIRSGGFVIDTLEASFWCLLTTSSYKEAVLKAVNLGGDTDTTAAVTGALAGLAYGLDGIPADWINQLAAKDELVRIARKMPRLVEAQTSPFTDEEQAFLRAINRSDLEESLQRLKKISTDPDIQEAFRNHWGVKNVAPGQFTIPPNFFEGLMKLHELLPPDYEYVEHWPSIKGKATHKLRPLEIQTRWTALLREDRFCEGAFDRSIINGSFYELLVQLKKHIENWRPADLQ